MELEDLIVKIVERHPEGIEWGDIVKEIQEAGYIHTGPERLSKAAYAIVRALVSRDTVKMVEIADDPTMPRRYFPPAA